MTNKNNNEVIELTPEQLFHHIIGDLAEQPVSSPAHPDGLFSNVEEKRRICKYLGYF